MKSNHHPYRMIDKRIRIASSLTVIALAVTLVSLLIFHPLSFIGYAVFGLTITIIANLYYFFALLSKTSRLPVPTKGAQSIEVTAPVVEAEVV